MEIPEIIIKYIVEKQPIKLMKEKFKHYDDVKKQYRYTNGVYSNIFGKAFIIINFICAVLFIALNTHCLLNLAITMIALCFVSYYIALELSKLNNGIVRISFINKLATCITIFISMLFATVGTPLSSIWLLITGLIGGALFIEISIQYRHKI